MWPWKKNQQHSGAGNMARHKMSSGVKPTVWDYHFNPVPVARQPGPAYHAPLLQFQEYPPTAIMGNAGIQVGQFFRPFEPMTVNQVNTPVVTGGSGYIQGQFYGAPLIDTSTGGQVA